MRKRVVVQDCAWAEDDIRAMQEEEQIYPEWEREASATREKARQYRQKKKEQREIAGRYLVLAKYIIGEVFESIPKDKDPVEYDALRMAMLFALDTLKPVERKVLVLRFGLLGGKILTLDEIASHVRRTGPLAPKDQPVRMIHAHHYDPKAGVTEHKSYMLNPTVTSQRIHQIEANAFYKMRHPKNSREIRLCMLRLRHAWEQQKEQMRRLTI